jgi:Ca2+-transporting ATPase
MGRMFVTAVGPNSFNGRLLLALRVSNEDTPLQEKLEVLAGHIL